MRDLAVLMGSQMQGEQRQLFVGLGKPLCLAGRGMGEKVGRSGTTAEPAALDDYLEAY